MFDSHPVDHDELPRQIRGWVRQIRLEEVVEAFVSSLYSRRVDLRSALPSYVIGRVLPLHSYHQRRNAKFQICGVCGVLISADQIPDRNRFSFERHRWGGVWIHDPNYIAFDLEQFAAGDHPESLDSDWEATQALLATIREASMSNPDLRAGGLADALRPVLPASNSIERRHLVTALAVIGVLEPRSKPSFRKEWIDFQDRPDPPEWKSTWFYPAGFWRGSDGIDVAAVREFFPRIAGGM